MGAAGLRFLGAAACVWAASLAPHVARAEPAEAVRLSLAVTADAWANLQGGLARGSVQLANIEGRADFDAEPAFGWRGMTATISVLHNDRATLSGKLVGDLQTADNKDATGGTRLYEAWVRQAFGPGYGKLGVIDLNSEFNVNRTGAVFINGAQGLGLDVGQLGASGPSVFPAPRIGAIAAVDLGTTVKLGLFDGAAERNGPTRRAGLAAEHGLLGLLEASRETAGGARLTAGVWRHSANFGSTLRPVRRRAASGGYVLIETPLRATPEGNLSGFLRVGVADPKTEQVGLHLSGGLVLAQPWLGVEGEALGVGVASAQNGEHFRRLETARGAPPERRETAIELTYRAPLKAGFAVQPDLQYIVHPGTAPGRRDAVVVGLRLDYAWSGGS